MIKKLFILLVLLGCASVQAQDASTFTTLVDENYLGAWALKQHNEICSKVHASVSDGKLQALTDKRKAMAKEQALKIFEEKIVSFISTDPDDPTIGYDTVYYLPAVMYYSSFATEGNYVVVHIDSARNIRFDKTAFYNLLTPDNRSYLDRFIRNNRTSLNNMAITAKSIMTKFNITLYKQCLDPSAEVYRSDSLNIRYAHEDMRKRSYGETVTFISTDRDDPTIGRDSVYAEYKTTPDTLGLQGIYFVMKSGPADMNLKLTAIASSYHSWVYFVWPQEYILAPFGFIRYEKVDPVILQHKDFLETLLRFTIREKLSQDQKDYKAYLELYGIGKDKD